MPPLKIRTRVLPGHRIEVTAPELVDGQDVDITISAQSSNAPKAGGILDFLDGLPSRRTLAEWEEFERGFQAERDAWER